MSGVSGIIGDKLVDFIKYFLQKRVVEERPWGKFLRLTENEKTTVKIIKVEPYSKLSLQYHNFRDEFWKIVQGECMVEIGDSIFYAKKDDEFFISRKIKHRIKTDISGAEILEISFGNFDELDIIRIEDDYGR